MLKLGLGEGTVKGVYTSDPTKVIINCGKDCFQNVSATMPVRLTATAETGSRFVRWEGTGLKDNTASPIELTINQDSAIRAVFEPNTNNVIPSLATFLNKEFTDAEVKAAYDKIRIPNHGLVSGQVIRFTSSGTLPAGLRPDTDYYALIEKKSDLVQVSSTPDLRRIVDITSVSGGGKHSILPALSPEAIRSFLLKYPALKTPAQFVAALDEEYRQNWILMTRSESLQTGTAKHPRIILPSADAKNVFTIGLANHPAYPASNPNAIEYMQWDPHERNFRLHEIVLDAIDPIYADAKKTKLIIPARKRQVSIDDAKCTKCHTTQNVLNRSRIRQGTSSPNNLSIVKNKPNWDAYDSWGGMLPFNRDRIYEDSIEEHALSHLLNLWNWSTDDDIRQVIELMELQPGFQGDTNRTHTVVRDITKTTDDDHIIFGFERKDAIKQQNPLPNVSVNYAFDGVAKSLDTYELKLARFKSGSDVPANGLNSILVYLVKTDLHIKIFSNAGDLLVKRGPQQLTKGDARTRLERKLKSSSTLGPVSYTTNEKTTILADVQTLIRGAASTTPQGGRYVTLRNPKTGSKMRNTLMDNPAADEGRGVEFFDFLGGFEDSQLNAQRIADEIINHRHTSPAAIDVRPITLAIAEGLVTFDSTNKTAIANTSMLPSSAPSLNVDQSFFRGRHGINDLGELIDDTKARAENLPRRKVDIQRLNLDRSGKTDVYLDNNAKPSGLIQQYGRATSAGLDTSITRVRRDIFQRPIDLGATDEVTKHFVDRELANETNVALYRFFLEPLGVSVDKWSMGVRGRSRGYNFADVFDNYTKTFRRRLQAEFGYGPTTEVLSPTESMDLLKKVNDTLAKTKLPTSTVVSYVDVQRIFNKNCIECHGGLDYPPYNRTWGNFNLSEEESPKGNRSRLSAAESMALV